MKARHPQKAQSSELAEHGRQNWKLSLYVAGNTPRSSQAFLNLQKICEEHLHGHYAIEVVDLTANPRAAKDEQIVAIPTVIRTEPLPRRKVIGDLSRTARVMSGLDLPQYGSADGSAGK